ncbi:MAG: antitoxin [Oscillospiraceae bacterium]|nr:antitoxin [Oscillospiraceae bacterium]
MSKYSDAQKEATARYNKKAYDRIDVVVKKGQRQVIKDFAASQGKSLNGFICDAIYEKMNEESKNE